MIKGQPTKPGWYKVEFGSLPYIKRKMIVEIYENPGGFMGKPNPCGLWLAENENAGKRHQAEGGDWFDYPLDHLHVLKYEPTKCGNCGRNEHARCDGLLLATAPDWFVVPCQCSTNGHAEA